MRKQQCALRVIGSEFPFLKKVDDAPVIKTKCVSLFTICPGSCTDHIKIERQIYNRNISI